MSEVSKRVHQVADDERTLRKNCSPKHTLRDIGERLPTTQTPL